MSYTSQDVRDIISRYDAPDPVVFFRLLLLNSEAVKFGDLGYAYFVQDQEEERNDYNEGALYYVFKVDSNEGEQFFRVYGNYDSFSGTRYQLNTLQEVKPGKVVRYTWEVLK